MLRKFQNHLSDRFPFLKGKKLLLAVSGGIDSMVMADLFRQSGFEIALAHCNFQLRGAESLEDENFVRQYADANKIPVFITHFDTKAFAADYKLSTQLAARELRYNWFAELLETENYDFILTAHHADDNLETFFINLSRGTGIDGLTGIPEQNDTIVRPLLVFSRNEIEAYAIANKIPWREDSSNASDDYQRNKIRHHLIPALREIYPGFRESLQKTQDYLQQTAIMAEDAAIMVYQQVAGEEGDTIRFDLKKLLRLPNYHSYLYQWLREFGFTAWDDIYSLVESQSGKQVFAPRYRLLKDRDTLIVSPIASDISGTEFFIDKTEASVNFPLKMTIQPAISTGNASNTVIFVDADKIVFPLKLRRWNEGDSFYPLGMKGQSKKISKLFKDEKLSLLDKENTWLLCSQEQIVWVVGIRQDERFKIENQTTNILQIAVLT